MKKKIKIPVLNGDGISDEIMAATKKVIEAAMEKVAVIEWIDLDIGEQALAKHGNPLPDEVIKALRQYKEEGFSVAIKGPSNTPDGKGYTSVNVGLRNIFDLFACIRPVKYTDGMPNNLKDPSKIDMVIFRENIEDLYAGIQFAPGSVNGETIINMPDVHLRKNNDSKIALGLKVISFKNTDRLMRKVIEYAKENGRKKITVAAKSNILKETDGLFVDVCKAAFDDCGQNLEFESMHIDAVACMLIKNPSHFDIIVTQNQYGDILSSEAAGLVGGENYCPGVNTGYGFAIFEATHGTAPSIAGKNIASPIALILSGAMMLNHMGYKDQGDAINYAVAEYFKNPLVTETDRIGTYISGISKSFAMSPVLK